VTCSTSNSLELIDSMHSIRVVFYILHCFLFIIGNWIKYNMQAVFKVVLIFAVSSLPGILLGTLDPLLVTVASVPFLALALDESGQNCECP
jgi:hypothetical protein